MSSILIVVSIAAWSWSRAGIVNLFGLTSGGDHPVRG
jgi:hypothetical protein